MVDWNKPIRFARKPIGQPADAPITIIALAVMSKAYVTWGSGIQAYLVNREGVPEVDDTMFLIENVPAEPKEWVGLYKSQNGNWETTGGGGLMTESAAKRWYSRREGSCFSDRRIYNINKHPA